MDGEDTVLVRLARALVCILFASCGTADRDGTVPVDLPATMLWTWERQEDLSFLRGEDGVGAASLVATVELAADGLRVRPNGNTLKLPEHLPRVAVVRLENVWGQPMSTRVDDGTQRRLVDVLVQQSRRLGASGLQIDFDAFASQRQLYADLLVALRPELPARHTLGITALASWCVGDRWLDDLPPDTLDYAVPMLFRMGRDAERIRAFVDAGRPFASPLCRRDVGLSTDEPWPRLGEGIRRWVFSPRTWTSMSTQHRPPASVSRDDPGTLSTPENPQP